MDSIQIAMTLLVTALAGIGVAVFRASVPRETFTAPCFQCGDVGPERTFKVFRSGQIACEQCGMAPAPDAVPVALQATAAPVAAPAPIRP